MSTLTDFLLARIADDEEGAKGCRDWSECHPEYGCPAHQPPARVLAECEAKRRIVTSFAVGAADVRRGTGEWAVVQLVLRLLALPYADHPDYREEWRP